MDMPIEHDRIAQRFSATVEGRLCLLTYRLADGVMTITHTGVPAELEGRGIAAELTRFAFETARREQWKIVPACSYAAAFARRHAQYADLLA